MGLRELPRRGQCRVGDAHHFRGPDPGGAREQRTQPFGNELSGIALIDTCFTVIIDLALVVVLDVVTCCHAFVVGVVCANEFAVELKLRGSMLPFLPEIVQG